MGLYQMYVYNKYGFVSDVYLIININAANSM
jgi:hypothetical protein